MPDLKHWLAKRKRKKASENRAEAAAEKKAEETGISRDILVDDPISDRKLKEAENRRKKFGRKVASSEGGDKLKAGDVNPSGYTLRGSDDYDSKKTKYRKKKGRDVIKEKHKKYYIPGSKKKTVTYGKATKIDPTIEYEKTVGGEYPKVKGTKIPGLEKDTPSNLKSTDWKEKSAEQMAKKGMPVKDPVKPTYEMKEVTVPKNETSAQKKERRARKVAFDNPDWSIKTKGKSVKRRGEKKPSKVKRKKVKEYYYGKGEQGNPGMKNSTDRNKVPDGKGGYK